MNAIAKARGFTAVMPDDIGIVIAILFLTGIIPIIGYLTTVVNLFIIMPIFINKSINMCKALRATAEEGK